MLKVEFKKDIPVWVIEENCKGCDICVSKCPAGVLGMRNDPNSILGKVISVDFPDSCIGCAECELSCPDFAIFIANRKEFKFSKLTPNAKKRAQEVAQNNFMSLVESKKYKEPK